MLVSELIEVLQQLPQDKTVLGRGYESGYNEITDIDTETLVKCDNSWYDGDYQDVQYPSGTPMEDAKEYICLT